MKDVHNILNVRSRIWNVYTTYSMMPVLFKNVLYIGKKTKLYAKILAMFLSKWEINGDFFFVNYIFHISNNEFVLVLEWDKRIKWSRTGWTSILFCL